MQSESITLTEYCYHYQIEPSFIEILEDTGIIELTTAGEQKYIHEEQFAELERYRLLHYELHINIEGIDAIKHLLHKQRILIQEIDSLKNLLHLYK